MSNFRSDDSFPVKTGYWVFEALQPALTLTVDCPNYSIDIHIGIRDTSEESGMSIQTNQNSERRCRTNLDDVSTRSFKALNERKWHYQYKLCPNHCNTVYINAVLN